MIPVIEPKTYSPPISLTHLHTKHEFDDVYTFSFHVDSPFTYKAGQNARLVLPHVSEDENARSMSFVSAPHEKQVVFSMHTNSQSNYKKGCLSLTPGDTVHIAKVKGKSLLPTDDERPLVFIAGGVGITPFASMLKDIKHTGRKLETTLIHVSSSEYLFQDELSKLTPRYLQIKRDEIIKTIETTALQYPNAYYYVVGPEKFISSVTKSVESNVADDTCIITSNFKGYTSFSD